MTYELDAGRGGFFRTTVYILGGLTLAALLLPAVAAFAVIGVPVLLVLGLVGVPVLVFGLIAGAIALLVALISGAFWLAGVLLKLGLAIGAIVLVGYVVHRIFLS